ncbi:MAG: sugar O-acetyltransferase [Candidatus Izemoplasmatales bacterium]
MTEKEKMLKGELYNSNDPELVKERVKCGLLLDRFNSSPYDKREEKQNLLKELLGALGNNSFINKPFFCDYGKNIIIGDNFFANYNLVFLDVNKITIGNNVMLGPNVSLLTASHPLDQEVRISLLEYGKPISIGDNVWIGGNTVINPGVKIGNNVVIGSGSVVTKDIPDNMLAYGNPCKVIRAIGEQDKVYWQKRTVEYDNL